MSNLMLYIYIYILKVGVQFNVEYRRAGLKVGFLFEAELGICLSKSVCSQFDPKLCYLFDPIC